MGFLSRFFRRKPVGPKSKGRKYEGAEGHRGIAAGSLEPGLKPFAERFQAPETVQVVASDQVSRFLYEGAVFTVHSSNVESGQYDIDKKILILTFKAKKGGSSSQYAYSDISEDEALHFAQAASKGGFVWSKLRIRGTKTGARKPYKRIR